MMKFRTINDLKTIDISDMSLTAIRFEDSSLFLSLEGAVIKADNANNNRYEDVYCTNMELVFKEVTMHSFCLQGFSYYDANGKLLNRVPSTILLGEEITKALDVSSEARVFSLECCDSRQELYRLIYDVDDDGEVKTYEAEFTFAGSAASWERFAGPVEG